MTQGGKVLLYHADPSALRALVDWLKPRHELFVARAEDVFWRILADERPGLVLVGRDADGAPAVSLFHTLRTHPGGGGIACFMILDGDAFQQPDAETHAPSKLLPKLLLVDDEPRRLKSLVEGLRLTSEVFIATSGADALRIARAEAPDLVLLDIAMPGMDGYEVCRRLKADPATRTIPVVFMAATTPEEDELQGLMLGAVDYFVKPLRVPVVIRRVATLLDLKQKSDLLERLGCLDRTRRSAICPHPHPWERNA